METINAQSIINEVTAAAETIKHAAELAGFGYAPEKITPAEIKKDAEFTALAKRAKGYPWGFELEHHAETEIMDVKAYTGARDTFSQLPEIEAQHRLELVRMAFEADAELLQDVPDLCGPEFVTIQTSARGHAKIKNTAGNLLAFAAKVRSHAAAFGGGLVRTIKPRAAIVWPAKSVSLFKQLIEDHDYTAALDLADSKLGALFCINKNGRALLQVAPVAVDTMPGMVSVMNEAGDFSIIEPVSMRCIPGTCKRTRNAQIEAGQRHYDTATPESKARILSEAEAMRVDQAACRAQWMAEHAIDDAQEIQARIDAQAAQDVAQVVASATAAAVIEQAQDAAALGELGTVASDTPAQAAQDAAPELETCDAMADSASTACEASTGAPGGAGGHGAGFATPAARQVAPVGTGQQIKGKSGHWSAHFYTSENGRACLSFTANGFDVGGWGFDSGSERMKALQTLAREADSRGARWWHTATPAERQAILSAGGFSDGGALVCANSALGSYGPIARAEMLQAIEKGLTAAQAGAPVGVSGSATTAAGTGAEMDPPANLNRNSRGYAGTETQPDGTNEASEPPANLNRKIDDAEAPDAPTAFEKCKPFTCNPLDFLAAGVDVRQLLGLGVIYTGNMANAEGVGAITEVRDERGQRFGALRLVCTLEDGRVVQAEPNYFEASLRPILKFNGMFHGAPYLAQLAATVATVKAQASAAKAQAEAAHAAALVDLVAQYPQLKRQDGKHSGGVAAAANMRILLKQAFKGCKFSIRSDYNSVRVNWTDGPTTAELLEVVGRFDIGASDTQSDYFYTVRTAWSELFGGCQYLSTYRSNSPEQVGAALAMLYPDASERPSVDDYIKNAGVFNWGYYDNNRANREMREQLETMGATPPAKTADSGAA